jgi:polysaccharide biosynthesis/export protein
VNKPPRIDRPRLLKCFGRYNQASVPKTRAVVVLAACAFTVFLFASCETPGVEASADQLPAPRTTTLAPGDVVKLSFSEASELNQSQKIRADGKINLPMIGEVDAAGRTIGSLQSELASRYKSELQNDTIIVTLESGIVQVVVSGAVSKPAKLSFDRPTTIFQAIMEAGGVTDYGNLKKVHLVRVVKGEQRTQVLDLSSTLGGKTTQASYVRDGDVIYVPQTLF